MRAVDASRRRSLLMKPKLSRHKGYRQEREERTRELSLDEPRTTAQERGSVFATSIPTAAPTCKDVGVSSAPRHNQ